VLDPEQKIQLLEDALVDLWQTCAKLQTEAALAFEKVLTEGDARTPSSDEVRGFLRGAIHGALLPRPDTRSRWRKTIDYLTKWE
jgi:hypothetical protein